VRRALARCVLLVALAVPALVSTAPPCGACTCTPRSPEQLYRRADAAFVGSVVGQEATGPTTTVQTFAVRSVFKGPLGATVDVIEPIGAGGGDTCGLLYGPGEVAVILFRQGDGQGEGQGEGWTTDVCSRITVAQLTSVGPSPVHPPPPSATATPTAGVPPSVGGSGGVGWRTGVLGLLVAIAALALALSLASRRGGAVATPPGATSDDGPGAGEPPEAGPSG